MAPKKKQKTQPSESELSKLVERDLTALAKEGKLSTAHGADASYAEVVALLEQERKSPLIAGDAGVGKSAVVQEVARRVASGLVVPKLADHRILRGPHRGGVRPQRQPQAGGRAL